MSYSQENGYIPVDIETIMLSYMTEVNNQFNTTYTWENFVGTEFYKVGYAIAQRLQENEVKTSEIFLKLQQYIVIVNQMISRPVNTNPGIIDRLAAVRSDVAPEGYLASVKPTTSDTKGEIYICVDVDDTAPNYSDILDELGLLISQITVAGTVTQGTEEKTIVLSNGQSFDFKFALPNRIPVGLRLTITLSESNQLVIGNPDDIKLLLVKNVFERYRLGRNFEPQRYFSVDDAPWASQVKLEWTQNVTDGEIDMDADWNDTVFDSEYDDLFEIDLVRVVLVEE